MSTWREKAAARTIATLRERNAARAIADVRESVKSNGSLVMRRDAAQGD